MELLKSIIFGAITTGIMSSILFRLAGPLSNTTYIIIIVAFILACTLFIKIFLE